MTYRYELTYFISPNLANEEVKILEGKIENIIKEEDGSLIDAKGPVKKNLARRIKIKLHPRTEVASLASLVFTCETGKITNIEKKIKEEKTILRYLLIKHIPKKIKIYEKRVPKTLRQPQEEVIKQDKSKLEEIEKKLDQILDNV